MNKPRILIFCIMMCLIVTIQLKMGEGNYTSSTQVCSDGKDIIIITLHSNNPKPLFNYFENSQEC